MLSMKSIEATKNVFGFTRDLMSIKVGFRGNYVMGDFPDKYFDFGGKY